MGAAYQLTNGILTFDLSGANDYRQNHCSGKVWLTLFLSSSADGNDTMNVPVRLFENFHSLAIERSLSLIICPSSPIQMLIWRVVFTDSWNLESIDDQCIQDIVLLGERFVDFRIESIIEYETTNTWGRNNHRAEWKREDNSGTLSRQFAR